LEVATPPHSDALNAQQGNDGHLTTDEIVVLHLLEADVGEEGVLLHKRPRWELVRHLGQDHNLEKRDEKG